jgi:hypothetical protein
MSSPRYGWNRPVLLQPALAIESREELLSDPVPRLSFPRLKAPSQKCATLFSSKHDPQSIRPLSPVRAPRELTS